MTYVLFGIVCIAAAVGGFGMKKEAPQSLWWYIPYAVVICVLAGFLFLN